MLHVLGLPSGKDIQRPAPFLPANARWSSPIAVDTMLYAATSAGCGGAPNGDLGDRSGQRDEAGGVVEDQWRAGRGRGGVRAGRDAVRRSRRRPDHWRRQSERDRRARSEDTAAEGLVHAACGRVRDRANHPSAHGQGDRRRGDQGRPRPAARRESLGGANHATPLYASKTWLGSGATVSADALATWHQSTLSAPHRRGRGRSAPRLRSATTWILLPVAGRRRAARHRRTERSRPAP